ncbi:ParB/RepB/Spo0J family partition protein [Kitasatospora cineracea]|uniref:ParB family chromosome partitioning protein n=1 Tax=Kitasatospora cineracea TaxID=88074 RepID=A0A3N4QZZ9_9ACTN|nr:ParB/RepB/Spo0J family partition protein [Kitasatospora cineracea]RPE26893.1 ParB family chromosome partitioning protein [Kitasatospora cineracea]
MTRAADRLGGGSSFGAVARPRSERGRAKAVAEGSIPDYELQRLELAEVRPSLVNPRRHFGTEEEQEALGQSLARKQTTACVAVTREAYLALWPDHGSGIGDAGWVLLNGERRYRSALRVGLEQLDFVVRDDLATSRADFIDYLMLENDERQDFNVIERAHGLNDLLRACDGNAAEVARRRGRDRSWVGNQIALLTLPAEIQEQLVAGALAERYARRLARALKEDPSLGAPQLLVLAEQLKAEERDRRQQTKDVLEAARGQVLSADNIRSAPPVLSADNTGTGRRASGPAVGAGGRSAGEGGMLSADNIPEQRMTGGADGGAEAGAVLSADNTGGAGRMLSADNIAEESAGVVPGGAGAGSVLSADNTGGGSGAVVVAAELVRALGATPAEQAATLRAGLDDEGFTALLEVLYAEV